MGRCEGNKMATCYDDLDKAKAECLKHSHCGGLVEGPSSGCAGGISLRAFSLPLGPPDWFWRENPPESFWSWIYTDQDSIPVLCQNPPEPPEPPHVPTLAPTQYPTPFKLPPYVH